MASLLPHQLKGLSSFVVEKVISDGAEGGALNVVGYMEEEKEKKMIVKVMQKPLTAEKIESLLRATTLESRAPYSGAEYGYYNGKPTVFEEAPLAVDVICPAALPDEKVSAAERDGLFAKLVQRNTAQTYRLVRETPRLFAAAHEPYINKMPSGGLIWLYKILSKEKEVERMIFDDEDYEVGFQLNVDSKWNTHPDCATVPRAQWRGHPAVKRLYCLGISHRKDIRSLRDLHGVHLPLLRNMRDAGLKAISEVYGLSADQVRVFVHYPPQFYHFHVHFTSLAVEGPGCFTERAVLLDDVIDALVANSNHFTHCNLTVRAGEGDPLMKALCAAEERATEEEGGSAAAKVARMS